MSNEIVVHPDPGVQREGNTLAAPCIFVKNHLADSNLCFVAKQIYRFAKDHLLKIVKFLIAWGLIVSFVGLIYGFKATAMPLAIGLGCGAAFGIVLAIGSKEIAAATRYKKRFEESDRNTIYGQISWSLYEQDEGTKAILITVTVTVIFAAMAAFPFEVGVILGVIVGNHFWMQMIHYGMPKRNHHFTLNTVSAQVLGHSQSITALTAEVNQLKARLEALENPAKGERNEKTP